MKAIIRITMKLAPVLPALRKLVCMVEISDRVKPPVNVDVLHDAFVKVSVVVIALPAAPDTSEVSNTVAPVGLVEDTLELTDAFALIAVFKVDDART